MANITNQPVWIIDTASATPLIACTQFVRIGGVRWVGATTGGHAATLQDGFGKTFWASVASGANYVEGDAINRSIEGLTVPTLASGTLYIEFI